MFPPFSALHARIHSTAKEKARKVEIVDLSLLLSLYCWRSEILNLCRDFAVRLTKATIVIGL
jgi:hypothetical protein